MTTPNWRQTLSEVERSIGDCLETLDRYEAAFAQVLAEAEPVVTLDRFKLPEIAPLLEHKLADADRTTDDVEKLLIEQDSIWHRWKETLTSWHGLLEQPA
ncbi:hypothetical protein BH11PLA2_BH11PLA2_50900 [soil metagenome]